MAPPRAGHGGDEWQNTLVLDSSESEDERPHLHVTSRRMGHRGLKGTWKPAISELKEIEPPYSSQQTVLPSHYRLFKTPSESVDRFGSLGGATSSRYMGSNSSRKSSRAAGNMQQPIRNRREIGSPSVGYPTVPTYDVDSTLDEYHSADDSHPPDPASGPSNGGAHTVSPDFRQTENSAAALNTGAGRNVGKAHAATADENYNAYQEICVSQQRCRQNEKKLTPVRYSSLAPAEPGCTDVSSSIDASFKDSFLTERQSPGSTPPSTAPNSFNSKTGVSSSYQNGCVDYEERYDESSTDVDEDIAFPHRQDKAVSRDDSPDTLVNDDELEESSNLLQESNRPQDGWEFIRKSQTNGGSDNDEEALLKLQKDFEPDPSSFPSMSWACNEDSGALPSSDDEYDVTESVAGELSQLDLDATTDPQLNQYAQKALYPVPDGWLFDQFPYFIQYEITRIALDVGLSLEQCREELPIFVNNYGGSLLEAKTRDVFLEALDTFKIEMCCLFDKDIPVGESNVPDDVWMALKSTKNMDWPESLQLTGSLEFSGTEELNPRLRLNALSLSQGHRFSYRFGSDRFLTLKFPSLSNQKDSHKQNAEKIKESLIQWLTNARLEVLNRSWRCFFIRESSESINIKGVKKSAPITKAFFFAETGVGLGKCTEIRILRLGFKGLRDAITRPLNRDEMTREDLIMWHMPVDKIIEGIAGEQDYGARGGKFAKAWSRVSLGLSTARPTVTFRRDQIKEIEDTKSTPTVIKPAVMDDGCCICSPEVMRQVREVLGLPEMPSAIQGRLGGAKGMWFVDPDADWSSDKLWIQVRSSQLKYEFHKDDDQATADWARLTLFVVKSPKTPVAAHLNSQLVPILMDRKVPRSVFKELLEEDLERDLGELLDAAKDRIALRRWLAGPGGMVREREGNGDIRVTDGGLPRSQMERIALLLDAGFEPLKCRYLIELLASVVQSRCNSVMDRTHISVPQSTVVFCIADPTGTLEPGEICLTFSSGFMDEREQRRITTLEGDVLVTRNPAHLPSDIQKVRAVYPKHPGLRKLQNVVIFSTKGDYPLAGLLSGGDYDGDTIWITWDPRLVVPFQNSKNKYFQFDQDKYFFKPELPPEDLYPDRSRSKFWDQFFYKGFHASILENRTGYCTSILERYMYAQGSKIRIDKTAVLCAKFCGIFVDALKQGLIPRDSTLEILKKLSKKYYNKPLYKSFGSKKQEKKGLSHQKPEGDPIDWFILDYLIFEVARSKADEKLKEFEKIRVETNMDYDLLDYWVRTIKVVKDSKSSEKQGALEVITHLEHQLYELKNDWCPGEVQSESEKFLPHLANFCKRYRNIRPLKLGHHNPLVESWDAEWDRAGSPWCLLRASGLFNICASGSSKLPWWLAVNELAYLKAMQRQHIDDLQRPRIIAADMYTLLKPMKQSRLQNFVASCGDDEIGESEGEYPGSCEPWG